MNSTSLLSYLDRLPGAAQRPSVADTPAPAGWTFLTNHTPAPVCLAQNEDITLREAALQVGITERAVHALETEGVLTCTREGQRNR